MKRDEQIARARQLLRDTADQWSDLTIPRIAEVLGFEDPTVITVALWQLKMEGIRVHYAKRLPDGRYQIGGTI